MAAGLPGTGLGRLFLILSALLMPLVALWRTVRRRTRPAGWSLVARNAARALVMVMVLGGAVGGVHRALLGSSPTQSGVPARSAGPSLDVGRMAPPVAPVLITLAVLGGILAVACTLRLILLGPRAPRKTTTRWAHVSRRGS